VSQLQEKFSRQHAPRGTSLASVTVDLSPWRAAAGEKSQKSSSPSRSYAFVLLPVEGLEKL